MNLAAMLFGVNSHPWKKCVRFGITPHMTSDPKFPSDLAERFQIRMPPGLRERIALVAEKEGRSMNALIVRVLENTFPPEPTLDDMLADLNTLLDAQSFNRDSEFERQLIRQIESLKLKISATRKRLAVSSADNTARKPDP